MVEDVNKRNRVMENIHNSSHFGINRTLDLVSSKYYWPGLTNDVKQYVSTTVSSVQVVIETKFYCTCKSLSYYRNVFVLFL